VSKLVANFGRRGKGKTSLAYFQAAKDGSGLAIFDPTHGFQIGAIVSSGVDFENALDGQISPVVFQVSDSEIRKDAVESDFAEFVHAIKLRQGISVIVDESSYLQSPNWIAPALDDEIRCGRRRKHDVYFTQHRMADCNGLLLSLVTEFNFFETKHPKDLERIAEYCSARIAAAVADLKDFEFLHYDVENGQAYVNVEPEFWRVNLAPEEPALSALSSAA
jgi:hypothetical protein